MTQKSLREEFRETLAKRKIADRAAAIETANKYLEGLADNADLFIESIKAKVGTPAKNQIEEVPSNRAGWKASFGATDSTVVFKNKALTKVTIKEVLEMSGYAKLNAICARPEVDMCLGQPVPAPGSLVGKESRNAPFNAVRIFVGQPYSVSEHAAAAQRERSRSASIAAAQKLSDACKEPRRGWRKLQERVLGLL